MQKKIGLILTAVVALSASLVLAETDYVAMKVIKDIQKGVDNANQIEDLRVLDDATIGGDVTVSGTLSLTGAATLSGALDVDSVTVDAGAGIDTQAAGALKVGEATATSVEIADTGVETDVQGTLSVDEDATFDSSVLISGLLRSVPTALSATNGQAVTVAEQVYLISGIGGADDTTNTVTLADPGTALLGLETTFIVAGASSNLITFADSGNLKLSSAWVGDNYDVIKLYAAETNVWVQTGEEDN